MKIVTYILIVVLVALLGAGGFFYMVKFKPMIEDYGRLKTSQPEFEKARMDLKKFRDREAQEKQDAAWIGPTAEALKAALDAEVKAGKADVAVVGSRLFVVTAEEVLYTPASKTFARDSRTRLEALAGALKPLKDKEIIVGNATIGAPAKGRRKTPLADARALAAARSYELVKFFEKNGVTGSALIAAAYPDKHADQAFKIKDKRTVIIIANPAPAAQKPEQKTALPPAPAKTPTPPAAAPAAVPAAPPAAAPKPAQPAAIPIAPAPPANARPQPAPAAPKAP